MAAVSVNMETQARLADYQSRVADCMEHIKETQARHAQLLQERDAARQKLEHESKIATAALGENVVIDNLPRDHPLRNAKCNVSFIESRIETTLRWCKYYQNTAHQLTQQKNKDQQCVEDRTHEQRDFEQQESDDY
jgi:E3 ubiquitin-protein ligase DOA10